MLAGVLAEHWADILSSARFVTEGDVACRVSLVLARCGKHLEDVAKLILEFSDVGGQKVPRGWMRCLLTDDSAPFDANAMEADIQGNEEEQARGDVQVYGLMYGRKLGREREESGAPTVLWVKPKIVTRVTTGLFS